MSVSSADSAVLSVAKIIVDTRYQIKVNSSSISRASDGWNWTGNFTITNYSDNEDTTTSQMITVLVDNNYENFVRQKIEKALKKEDSTDYSISGMFKFSNEDFNKEIKKYSLTSLSTFHDACQACIDILIEQGISDSSTWEDRDPNLYNDLYYPYYTKLQLLEDEMKVREDEINTIIGIKDDSGATIQDGLQTEIIREKNKTQKVLDFEKYLGTDLWCELNTYRRETSYSNTNYISDGLSNNEIFAKALEFLETANKELYKSAQLQQSITVDNLKNLLAIKKYEPLKNSFEVGNWVRTRIDDQIYKLRLLTYEVNFSNFEHLSSVQFSNVLKIKDGISDVKDTLSKASSIAKSYDGVYHQMDKSKKTNTIINSWFENGLSTTNTKIVSGADGQEQIWDSHGMLFQKYDSITGTYSPVKFKFINSCLVLTTDNFKTTKATFGEFQYQDPRTGEIITAYGVNGEVIVGKLLIGKYLSFYNESNTLIFDTNGLSVSNDLTSVSINPNASSLFSITKLSDKSNLIQVTKDGNLAIVGDITAKSLTLLDNTTIDGNHITGLSTVAMSGKYSDLIDTPKLDFFIQTDKVVGQAPKDGATGFVVSSQGLLQASNAIVYGSLYSSNGKIGGWDVGNGYLRYKDTDNYYSGMCTSNSTTAFYAGGKNVDGSDAKFRVKHNGNLYAEDATITGDVTANNFKVQDGLNLYVNGYDVRTCGKLIYLETSDADKQVDLIIGKTLNSHFADNTNVTSSLNFGRVVIPGTLIVGNDQIDVGQKISALETQISKLEERVKELEG